MTKAALYYHFKSKEDIVRSLVEDYFGRIDALVSWGENEPPGPARRAEILRRYVAIVAGGRGRVPDAAPEPGRHQDPGRLEEHRRAVPRAAGPADRPADRPRRGLEDRLRAAMALGGISMGWMVFSEEEPDRSRLSAAVLQVASEIAG